MNGSTERQHRATTRIMSFNIRRPMREWPWNRADHWSVRESRLRALVQAERPTVLAAQEVFPAQARSVQSALGPQYRKIGYGRSRDGRGEACPVFYDASRLELREWRQFALSDTPEVPGSRSWGSVFPRVVVSAVFRDRTTSALFRLMNTHLDPFSGRARSRAADVIRTHVASSAEPVVVTGDLNAAPGSTALELLQQDGTLVDAWQAANERSTPEYGTFQNYRQPRPGRRIDWILTTPTISVERVAIDPTRYLGGWASDHLPIQAEVVIPHREGNA
ncbi:endonuclease/exonuclease/phosphatase family protein [Humidisolicoccus flavus]|uniref:endonuclease/exonuclease/phosphatase family protein n=1 Tax=Humidisolicoccus flavus TaxID=3111414 RepID=UPI00324E3898